MSERAARGLILRKNLEISMVRRLAALQRAGAPLEGTRLPIGAHVSPEKIIRRTGRPTILVQDGTFVPDGDITWRAKLTQHKAALERALPSVGRVEMTANGRSAQLGTGWMVAPGVAVTNRHVALEFARSANGGYPFRTDALGNRYQARIDFRQELQRSAEAEVKVVEVLYIAPDDEQSPDIALLKLAATDSDGRPVPPPLSVRSSAPTVGLAVAALGYPAYDPEEEDQAALQDYFGHAFGVKRLAPGFVVDPPGVTQAWAFTHDCTTLGGSSGSPVVDLEDGSVVGMHFSGISGQGNFAVRASDLSEVLAKLSVHAVLASEVTLAALASESSLATSHIASDEEKTSKGRRHAPEHFAGREGYAQDFLGVTIELPQPITSLASEAATFQGPDGETTNELRYTHFSVVQSASHKLPWITGVNIDGNRILRLPRPNGWFRDGRLPDDSQSGDEIYVNSGFSRGHMVRRLDPCWGSDEVAQQANEDTFHFTNACPQEQVAFNDKLWGDLEDYILDNAVADHLRINVYTGPVFEDDNPTVNSLPIPLKFWKVVAWRSGSDLKAVGFVLSQRDAIDIEFAGGPYQTSERSLKSISKMAGLTWPQRLLEADVHRNDGDEAAVRPMRSLDELDRHFG